MEWGIGRSRIKMSTSKLLGVMDVFITPTALMASHIDIKTYQVLFFKHVPFKSIVSNIFLLYPLSIVP